MLVDSHCHVDFPELADDLSGVVSRAKAAGVDHLLCVSVNLRVGLCLPCMPIIK